jgi:type IV pilus assembly protein PilB
MVETKTKKLGERLIEMGLLTPEQLRIALEIQKRTSLLLGQVLIDLGFVDEHHLSSLVSEDMGAIHLSSLEGITIDPEAMRLVPKKSAIELKAIPLSIEDGDLTVALTDPFDIFTVDKLRKITNRRIRTLVASEADILRAIEFWYTDEEDLLKDIIDKALASLQLPGGALTAEEPPIVKLVNHIILMGVKDGATDIHIEPEKNALLVRFRVDGIMRVWEVLPKALERSIVSRLKVMANLDISENRLPQDGRADFYFGSRLLDLRISVFPTSHGENVVIRILDRTKLIKRVDELGFDSDTLSCLRRLIHHHQGIVLVTGPTGSGKTTTLYATLMEITSPKINIMTIEDPIEYNLPFIRQSQVNPRAQLTFARGLRSILRQDPDVILVGEIRDSETLDVSIHAALTGHLVFSTLHTNSAIGAIPRLFHMGAPEHILATCLNGIIAQRLARKICPECKIEYRAEPEEEKIFRDQLGKIFELPDPIYIYRGKGCEHCKGEGYSGRFAIGEIVEGDPYLFHLISKRASEEEISQVLSKKGYRTMYQNGLIKVLEGQTTLEELSRIF